MKQIKKWLSVKVKLAEPEGKKYGSK